jgi:hypothetical protein
MWIDGFKGVAKHLARFACDQPVAFLRWHSDWQALVHSFCPSQPASPGTGQDVRGTRVPERCL